MFNFKKDFDFSKVLLIILIIVIISASVISIKIAFVRMNDWTLPPKPIQLIKPSPSRSPAPGASPAPDPSSIPGSTILPTNNPNNPDTPDDHNSPDVQQEWANAARFVGNLITNLLTHPAFYEAMSFIVALDAVTKAVVYLARIGVSETLRFAAIKALCFVEKVVLGLANKFGIKALEKFGISLTEDVIKGLVERSSLYVAKTAEYSAETAGELAATALLETATKVGLEEAAEAFTGPIGVAFDVLQAAGMLLDMFDIGGYKKMQENEIINKTKKGSYDALMLGLSGLEAPMQLRPLKGPLYDLYKTASEKDPESKDPKSISNIILKCYNDAIYNIMNSPSFIDAYMLALDTDHKMYYKDEEMKKFMNLHVNPEIVLRYCNEIQCENYDGVSVRLSGECSFKDYDTCFKSNVNYPDNPPKGEVYVEWDANRKECSMATTTVKEICRSKEVGKENNTSKGGDDEGIAYDPITGLCNINDWYCHRRYGESVHDDNGYPDCYITGFQSFWENIFGKTLVRALIR